MHITDINMSQMSMSLQGWTETWRRVLHEKSPTICNLKNSIFDQKNRPLGRLNSHPSCSSTLHLKT